MHALNSTNASTLCSNCIATNVLLCSGLLGVAANLITGFALLKVKDKRVTIYLLMSLTLADLLYASCQLVASVLKNVDCGCFSRTPSAPRQHVPFLAEVSHGFRLLSAPLLYGVIFTMLLMTLERLVATVNPYKFYKIVTKKRVAAAIIVVWISVILLLLSHLLTPEVFRPSLISINIHQTLQCFVLIGVAIIILICYRIIHSRIKNKMPKTFITTTLILATFFVLWVPCAILYILLYLGGVSPEKGSLMFVILYCSVSFNAVVDPIIYGTRNPMVKTRLKKMFCCSKPVSAERESRRCESEPTLYFVPNCNEITSL